MSRTRTLHPYRLSACWIIAVTVLGGCFSQPEVPQNALTRYQQNMARRPSRRQADQKPAANQAPLDLLRFLNSSGPEDLDYQDANAVNRIHLSLNEVVLAVLAGNEEIRQASFTPEIKKWDITESQAEFDPTVFGEFNYDIQDQPTTTSSDIGQADTRRLESGIKQKNLSGTEWSARYVVTRTWDDYGARPRSIQTRWQPVLAFQLRKPLWRDGDRAAVTAGIDIARLNHRIALQDFRQAAEKVATEATYLYWQLYEAHQDLEIQRNLHSMALETLEKVRGRRDIDATDVQIQQALASVRTRQSLVLEAEKQVQDVQDALIQLIAGSQVNLLQEVRLEPTSSPLQTLAPMDHPGILGIALERHPAMVMARLAIEVADLNIKIAENQRMPRLDFVLSANTTRIENTLNDTHEHLFDGDYFSKAVGLTMEYPLGNRSRRAEFQRRRLERLQALSKLRNTADEIAVQVKQAIRDVETRYAQISIQHQAMDAAEQHLEALEETESIRDRLTPEFLSVKLQAQEAVANARRAHIQAIVQFNLALARLSQVTGSVLKLHRADMATLLDAITP